LDASVDDWPKAKSYLNFRLRGEVRRRLYRLLEGLDREESGEVGSVGGDQNQGKEEPHSGKQSKEQYIFVKSIPVCKESGKQLMRRSGLNNNYCLCTELSSLKTEYEAGVRGRLHVSDSVYESPFDSLQDLHTKCLWF
jgi:hypothetical protein